jgi:hypothetical protein
MCGVRAWQVRFSRRLQVKTVNLGDKREADVKMAQCVTNAGKRNIRDESKSWQ